jgi:LEA14-like dessication related protein
MASKRVLAAVIIIVVILAIIGYSIISSYEAVESLTVTEIKVTNIVVHPADFTLSVVFQLHNPTGYKITLKDVRYAINIESYPITSGVKPLLIVQSNSDSSVEANFDVINCGCNSSYEYVMNAVRESSSNTSVQLSGTTQLTLFNTVELPLSSKFSAMKNQTVGFITKPPVTINAYWLSTSFSPNITLGESITFIVKAANSNFTAQVREENSPDKLVSQYQGYGFLSPTFTPNERGTYYLRVTLPDETEFVQQEDFRLKVT